MSEFQKVKLSIKNESFYNNGSFVLSNAGELEGRIRDCLSSYINVKMKERKNSSELGISADSVNDKIREVLSKEFGEEIKMEAAVKNGSFVTSGKKEGFDFAWYDDLYNNYRLYKYYIGYPGVLNGKELLEEINDVKSKYGVDRRGWKKKVGELEKNKGIIDGFSHETKDKLTIVGEIQLGNWALAYRDLFRVLNANKDYGVDLYIYIAPTDTLENKISSATVNYAQIVKIIEESRNIIQMPIWVIGLDVGLAKNGHSA